MQPRPKMIFAFIRNGKGAVAVAFKKANEHGAFFGAAHVFLKFPVRDGIKRLFVHVGVSSRLVEDRTRPKWNLCDIVAQTTLLGNFYRTIQTQFFRAVLCAAVDAQDFDGLLCDAVIRNGGGPGCGYGDE